MKRIIIIICTILSLLLAISVVIPFYKEGTTVFELRYKFLFSPITIFILSVPSIIYQYKNFDEIRRFDKASVLFPSATYISASFFFLATLLFRNHEAGKILSIGEVNHGWIVIFSYFLVLSFVIFIFTIFFSTTNFKKTTLLKTIIFQITLFCLLTFTSLYGKTRAIEYGYKIINNNGSNLIFIVSIIWGSIFFFILILSYFTMVNNDNYYLIEKEKIMNCHTEHEEQIYLDLFNFIQDKLEEKGYSFDVEGGDKKKKDEPLEKIIDEDYILEKLNEQKNLYEMELKNRETELVNAKYEAKKLNEEINELIARIEELEKPKEEVKKVNIKETVSKEKKVINPTPDKLIEYINENFSDCTVVKGKVEGNFKAFKNKNLFLSVQSTTNDYRITFQRNPISLSKMLIQYSGLINKAKVPNGDQWFKIINNGKVSTTDIYDIIKFSYKYLVDEENRLAIKKAKDKEKELALKAKAKAKEDEMKLMEKAKKESLIIKEKEKKTKDKSRSKYSIKDVDISLDSFFDESTNNVNEDDE